MNYSRIYAHLEILLYEYYTRNIKNNLRSKYHKQNFNKIFLLTYIYMNLGIFPNKIIIINVNVYLN